MSNTIDSHLQVYRYEDPLMDVSAKPIYTIERSAQNHKIRSVEAYQHSSNQINYVYNPPQGHVISRSIRTIAEFKFVFSGNTGGAPLLDLNARDGFRMLEYGIASANLNLDNGQNQYIPADVYPLYHRYMSTKELNDNMGFTFNTPDLLSDFDQYTDVGSAYNVLSGYGEQGAGDDNLHGRNLQSQITVIENSDTRAEVDVRFVSPIFLTPLTWKNNDHKMKGLFGVERLIYNIQFKSNLGNYLYCHNPGFGSNAVTLDSVTLINTPSLEVQEWQPQPDIPMPLDMVAYKYSQVISRVNSTGKSAVGQVRAIDSQVITTPGGEITVSSNSDQVNGTPSYVSFYLRERDSDRQDSPTGFSNPITALRIKSLNILWDTVNVLNLADPEQIYEVCKKNGYNGNYNDWYSLSGGYVRLRLPTDIPLSALDAVGRLIRHNVQITVTGQNISTRNLTDIELVVMYEYDGIFTKQQNYGQSQVNIVSPNDVLNSDKLPELPREYMLMQQAYKGGLSLSEVYHKAKSIAPKALALAKKCGPDSLSLIKDVVGRGYNDDGQGLQGGRMANKRKLSKRLQRY